MLRLLKRRNTVSSVAEGIENESVETLHCRFDGTTKDYFELWVVNLLMIVCTLGLARPWAKARQRQYLYSNTWLGKHNVKYFAEPRKSLAKTAVINLSVLVFVVALLSAPMLSLAIAAVYVLLYPLARHDELLKDAAATSYRNQPLVYTGKVKDSYLRLIGWPIATVVSAFLLLGHSMRSSWGYRYENYNYGKERFSAKFKVNPLWGLVFKTGLYIVLVTAMVLVFSGVVLFYMDGFNAIEYYVYSGMEGKFDQVHALIAAVLLISMIFPVAVWRTTAERIVLASVRLEAGISFDSELSQARIFVLYLFNALAILLTLGFAIPWATIRVAKYRASVTTMVCYADLDKLAGDQAAGLASLTSVVAGNFDRADELNDVLDEGELDLPKAA